MIARVLCVMFVCLGVGRADAENWPQFRGPDGDGHSSATGLPTEWSNSRNVAWKRADIGEGWSSPVVWENRIYLTAARPRAGGDDDERNLYALCLDADNGNSVWEKLLFEHDSRTAQRIHKKNSHASPTPFTDGEFLWVHFGTQGTACLTLGGEVVWKRNDIAYQMQHGNGGSPIVVDDVLFFGCDGSDRAFAIALDKRTGETRWRKERPPVVNQKTFSFSTATAIEVDGRKQILSQGSDIITAFDPQTGDELWWFKYRGYSVIPRPVYAHGLVYVCTSYDSSRLHAIDPTGRGDVTATHERWSEPKNVAHTPSLLVVGSELYCISDRGIATCFDALTGAVHWQERIGGNFSASPIYADGKIYFLSEEGITTVVRADTSFERIARNELDERTLASIAVIGDDLLIRTENNLYRIR